MRHLIACGAGVVAALLFVRAAQAQTQSCTICVPCAATCAALVFHSPQAGGAPGEITVRRVPWGVQYLATFDKPVAALIVDVMQTFPDGSTSTHTGKRDNFLRQGSRTISGHVGWSLQDGQMGQLIGRIRYVEYEDGSTDGDMDPAAGRQVFEPMRWAVKRLAAHFALVARQGGRKALQEALATARSDNLIEDEALKNIKVHVQAMPGIDAVIERLDRLAQPGSF